jgi:hypothetical protein
MKYALLIYSPSTAEDYAAMAAAARETRDRDGEWVKYTRAAKDAGVLAAAEQLTHTETATSVRVRDGGERLITDGPFMETKEHLLGFYLIDVPDLDAALEWAARMPAARTGTVEVRAAISGMAWQQVLD